MHVRGHCRVWHIEHTLAVFRYNQGVRMSFTGTSWTKRTAGRLGILAILVIVHHDTSSGNVSVVEGIWLWRSG